MSSKNVEVRPWSLAARLTLWFFCGSFALVLSATAYLYFVLAANLDEEDDHFLTDRARAMLALVRERSSDPESIRQQVEWTGPVKQASPKIYLRVLDPSGRILAATPRMNEVLNPGLFPPPRIDQGFPLHGQEFHSAAGRWYRLLTVQGQGMAHTVQGAMDRTHEVELLEEYRRNLWIVLAAALVLSSAGAYLVTRRAIRPVADIAATAARIRSSTLHERLELSGLPAELRTLADTFNEMLDRLESSFARLAQFSADIAHELRTPLNILRGEAEVAFSRPRSPDEYREVIASSLEEYDKLARMIENLLFLARAENPATQIVREAVDVRAELERLREYYEAAAAEAKVNITVAGPGGLQAALDRNLLQRAVGNCIDNALRHTPPGGTVTLSADQENGWLDITITDTGKGIEPEHLPHLFDRFYKADPVRRATRGGNVGLGLALVRSIAELHGGTASVSSEPGKGSRFKLRFPSHAPG